MGVAGLARRRWVERRVPTAPMPLSRGRGQEGEVSSSSQDDQPGASHLGP